MSILDRLDDSIDVTSNSQAMKAGLKYVPFDYAYVSGDISVVRNYSSVVYGMTPSPFVHLYYRFY